MQIPLFMAIIIAMITGYTSFVLGQDNPLPQPMSDKATIVCPFGSEFSFSRGADATLTVTCIYK